MAEFELNTPVVFIIFNRPEETKLVFDEIAKVKPTKLFVISDGARDLIANEREKVAAAREIIKNINWECEVFTNFSSVNLGCKLRVSSGLDWVFNNVEEAIILEDDCLPDSTFFQFCQELLERYRDDQRIGMISGDNFQFGFAQNDDSYYFSNITHIWGWATWRTRWSSDYDVEMSAWPKIRDEGAYLDWFHDATEKKSFYYRMEKTYNGEIDTWDNQWQFSSRLTGRISIMPNANLITNIVFGPGATHTTVDSVVSNMSRFPMRFPLKHPVGIFASTSMDERFTKYFSRPAKWRSIKDRMLMKINWWNK